MIVGSRSSITKLPARLAQDAARKGSIVHVQSAHGLQLRIISSSVYHIGLLESWWSFVKICVALLDCLVVFAFSWDNLAAGLGLSVLVCPQGPSHSLGIHFVLALCISVSSGYSPASSGRLRFPLGQPLGALGLGCIALGLA